MSDNILSRMKKGENKACISWRGTYKKPMCATPRTPPPTKKCKNQRFQVVLKLGGRKVSNSTEEAIWAVNPLPHPTLPSNQPLHYPARSIHLFPREDGPEKHYSKGNTLGSVGEIWTKNQKQKFTSQYIKIHHPSSSHFPNNPQNTYLQMMGGFQPKRLARSRLGTPASAAKPMHKRVLPTHVELPFCSLVHHSQNKRTDIWRKSSKIKINI